MDTAMSGERDRRGGVRVKRDEVIRIKRRGF